jgi:hypothetical protein
LDNLLFIKYEVKNHTEIKKSLLLSINKNINSYKDNDQSIYNTDWFYNQNIDYRLLSPHIKNLCWIINNKYYNKDLLDIAKTNIWFQQYKKNDYHDWHVHSDCLFSCVYYLDLDYNNSQTSFKINNKEFNYNVKEGEILLFPSIVMHCSKPNKTDKIKTVIAFNLN